MKKILLFVGLTTLCSSAFSQTQIGEGSVMIDPYIGIPNWANSILYNESSLTNAVEVSDYKVNGGQVSYGGRVEYMISDDFGVGLDLNYEVSGYNYNDIRSVYDEITMSFVDAKYNYDYTAKKFRAMFRLNYHFVQTDRADAYTAFAGGYKAVNRSYTSNEPNYDAGSSRALIPVAFRFAVGTRIYFTNNIGMHMEIGIFGGALLQVGVSFKIPTY